jgi:hypothetical protein
VAIALNRQADPTTHTVFAALMRFAAIAGLGAQTTHGFGATDLIALPHPKVDRGQDMSARHRIRRGPRKPCFRSSYPINSIQRDVKSITSRSFAGRSSQPVPTPQVTPPVKRGTLTTHSPTPRA